MIEKKYCLDANVLIQAWQKYYSPNICPSYWEMLNMLGKNDKIFIPELVYEEIIRTDDELSKWLKKSKIPIRLIDEQVAKCLKEIYLFNPIHRLLVDNKKLRSMADPWVIAHAINENAIVVTKEEKITAQNANTVKIPNVCENMKVPCINDFQFIFELGIWFQCNIKTLQNS